MWGMERPNEKEGKGEENYFADTGSAPKARGESGFKTQLREA